MQDPLVLKRERGLKKINEGINHYNNNKGSIKDMTTGHQLMVSGIEDLVQYKKQESNQEIVKTLNGKLIEFFNQAEQMKKELKGLEITNNQNNQQGQQNTLPLPNTNQQMGNYNSKINQSANLPQNNYNNQQNQQNPQNPQNNPPQQPDSEKPQQPIKDEENNKLAEGLQQAIVTENPNVHWDDIAGLENAKKALQEAVILPIKFPQIFQGAIQPWKGILLYGPPGTGKTFLAKACATECNSTFFSISSADLISKFVGESEKLIKQLFKMAREKKPSIIFIDEVDSMTGNREGGGGGGNEASQRVKTQFLIEMQGVGNDDKGVLVLGATNLPWGLDPAIRRRFEKRIYISLPEGPARTYLLKNLLKKTDHTLQDQEIEYIGSQATNGFSGADMSILIRDASYEPLRKCERATTFKPIIDNMTGKQRWIPCSPSDPQGQPKKLYDLDGDQLALPQVCMDDFQTVLGKIKPSVSPKDIEQHIEWTQQFGQEG